MSETTPAWRRILAVIAALFVGAVVSDLVKEGVLKKVDLAEIVVESSHETLLTMLVGHRDARGIFRPSEKIRQQVFPGELRKIRFRNLTGLGDTLQFQLQKPITLTIHQLLLYNARAGTTVSLHGQELADLLRPAENRSQVRVENGLVVMEAAKPGASLTLYAELHQRNQFLRYALALLFAALTYILIRYTSPQMPKGVEDIFQPPGSRYQVELDGLRGLAALTVMLEHTWSPFAGIGATGIWLFFILSGYLLSQPFINKPERAINPGYVGPYFVRRLARILPMYLVVLFVSFGFTERTPELVEHLLFLDSAGHFWTIPQELSFYLFLPFLMIVGYLAHRLSPRLFAPTMLLLCALFLWRPELAMFELRGNGISRPPYVGWFLMGVALAAYGPMLQAARERLHRAVGHFLGLIGAAFLIFILSASSYGITGEMIMKNVTLPVNFPRVFGIAAAIIMLLVILAPRSPLGMLLRLWPLRAIGVVAYSFYLLHPIMIGLIIDISEKFWSYTPGGPDLFIYATIATWLVSLFTYAQIERPFLSRAKASS